MAPTPGILYVTMQPKPSLPIAQFHDWYNNEHGPGRLRLSFCENGFRYRATDLESEAGRGKPEWMAIYDITDMDWLTKEIYTRLRMAPVQSQRERNTMKQITVDRKFFDLVSSRQAKEFKRLEEVGADTEGNVLVAVSMSVHPGKGKELDKWYEEEHVEMLSKVPGWLRTRRFVTASIEGKEQVEYLALHEYAPKNGLGESEEFKAAIATPWHKEIYSGTVSERRRRLYNLYYTFGPAPRDLSALSNTELASFASTDNQTRTQPASPGRSGAIESYVTTTDGVVLPYRLQGSSDPSAPLIVFSNSILVEWGIWDDFLVAFFSKPQNRKYRVLRYHSRGRTSACGDQPITVDLLASDIVTLLDALRVPKAAAVIGVSLGGATALTAGLKYPDRFAAFVSCDTSAKSPDGNEKAWGDRIAISDKENAQSQSSPSEKIVGEELAELTVRRWFVKESYDGGAMEAKIAAVKTMVVTNSFHGFSKSVEALFAYDLRDEMKKSTQRGGFLVGGGDGVLPASMKQMAAGLGESGTEDFFVIDGAGHLPMVEKPTEVADAISSFLEGQ